MPRAIVDGMDGVDRWLVPTSSLWGGCCYRRYMLCVVVMCGKRGCVALLPGGNYMRFIAKEGTWDITKVGGGDLLSGASTQSHVLSGEGGGRGPPKYVLRVRVFAEMGGRGVVYVMG